MAKPPSGKPADVELRYVDDQGNATGTFASVHDGMGRFEFTPEKGRKYHVEVVKPAGIITKVDVPAARPEGCVLRAVDQKGADTLRIAAICSSKRKVEIEATLRENRLAGGSFEAGLSASLAELPISRTQQGAVRVPLFDDKAQPLAERLVYHGMGANLKVTITADKKSYAPRDQVK